MGEHWLEPRDPGGLCRVASARIMLCAWQRALLRWGRRSASWRARIGLEGGAEGLCEQTGLCVRVGELSQVISAGSVAKTDSN
jgi:hypothetical protein